jgi:RND family efflux transporter MFP subunit
MNKLISLSIVFMLLVSVSCQGKKKDAGIEQKPIAVTVSAAVTRNITISKTYTGTLEGFKQAKIYSSIPEAVVELPITEGSQVDAGQSVILLDKEGMTSRYRQSEAIYQDAKDNLEKMGRLFKQGAISEQAYNAVRTGFEVARANYTSAKQQVELTSPISGILTDLSVNIGQYAPLGVPLATIAQTDRMRLTIFVDSRSSLFVKNGQIAKVAIDLNGNTLSEFEAVVTEVAKSADPETRLFRVELQIENRDKILRPGSFARATINISELKNVLTVPRESVFIVEGVAKIYKLSDMRAREQTITLGESTQDSYQILSGLESGENVIVLGRNLVEDGSLVKVVENNEINKVKAESKES